MACIRYRPFLWLFVSISSFFSGLFATSNDGYILPVSGNASTTQFHLGPELASGSSCGVNAWANGMNCGSPSAGGGPGYLYAAINQLAFGANPAAPNGGGPGAACGLCYKLTPISATGLTLDKQALTFMIIDECPAGNASSRSAHCGMCSAGEVNDYGQEWHFDIAVDAMNKDQYNTFFRNVTDGSNWNAVSFTETCCTDTSPRPPLTDWGCLQNCTNNESAPVCINPSPFGPNSTSVMSSCGLTTSTVNSTGLTVPTASATGSTPNNTNSGNSASTGSAASATRTSTAVITRIPSSRSSATFSMTHTASSTARPSSAAAMVGRNGRRSTAIMAGIIIGLGTLYII